MKTYEVPFNWKTCLAYINEELCRVQGNGYSSPFSNTGNSYKNDTFEVVAYDWSDDSEQSYNFKWKDVEISWYKYLGRGMYANQELKLEQASVCLVECIKSINAR